MTLPRATPAGTLIFLACLAAYLANGHSIRSGDTAATSLLPIAVLLDGTLRLDRFAAEEARRSPDDPYFLVRTPRGVVSFYPVAAGLLAIPVYVVPVLIEQWRRHPTPGGWIDFAPNYEKLAAATLTALSAAAFWAVCGALGFATGLRLGLTAFYGLGSEAFATSAQALWQHGPGSLAFIAAIGGFVALDRGRPGGAWLLSLCAGLAVAIRLNNVLLTAPLVLLALGRHPRRWPALILPGAGITAALVAYNQYFFGLPLGPYQASVDIFRLSNMPAGLAGSAFSPARGLFVYFPVALVVAGLLLRHPALLGDRLVVGLCLGILGTTALNASFEVWWGGHCFGPRYFAESEPAILIVLGIGLGRLAAPTRRWLGVLCFGLLLPYSVLVQTLGAYSLAVRNWNVIPIPIDVAPDRLWDAADSPILRGLRGRPPGA